MLLEPVPEIFIKIHCKNFGTKLLTVKMELYMLETTFLKREFQENIYFLVFFSASAKASRNRCFGTTQSLNKVRIHRWKKWFVYSQVDLFYSAS